MRAALIRVVLAALVLSVVPPVGERLAFATAGNAGEERRCELQPSGRLLCVNRDDGDEAQPASTGGGSHSSALGRWTSYETDGPEAQIAGGIVDCGYEADGVTPVSPLAIEFIDSDGNSVVFDYRCPSPGGAVPVPPAPPGPAEVWGVAPVTEPVIGVNPDNEGLTGLDTWLWGYDSGPVPVSVTLRGYTVTGIARIVRWTWEMGDPQAGFRESSDPGSEEHPAASYTYETKGDYTLVHSTYWRATFTVSGHGLPDIPLDAGAVATSVSRPYDVVEVRGIRQRGE